MTERGGTRDGRTPDAGRALRRRRWAGPVVGTLLAALACATPAAAQDTHFKIFGAASWVSPLSEEDVSIGGVRESVKTSDELGWDFGIEFRPTKALGIEVDYLNVSQDVEFGGTTIGEVDLSPLSATLNFHLIPTTLVDFYFGPTLSWVNWGNVELNGDGSGLFGGNELGTESETAWGASLGLDIGLGKRFAFTGGLRWLNLDLTSDGQGAAVNPLFSRVGIALRW